MNQHTVPAPGSSDRASGPHATTIQVPLITWEWLHGIIATALRHIELGAPLYLTADVLTDELFPPLKGIHRPEA